MSRENQETVDPGSDSDISGSENEVQENGVGAGTDEKGGVKGEKKRVRERERERKGREDEDEGR